MPFPFPLPTTSAVFLPDFFTSSSHPSLPLETSIHRSVLRDALKKHKRLPAASQASNLPTVQNALIVYLPYLLALLAGLRNETITGNRIEIYQIKPLETQWRCTLTASLPGREPARVKLPGLHAEVAFVVETLAYTYSHLARTQLLAMYSSTASIKEQRANAISTAMKHLLTAQSLHSYASTLVPESFRGVNANTITPVDISPSTISALSALALAEATIVVVQKDDPYAAAVAEDRNKTSNEWMISAPSIPKVRAHLFARLCIAAADHAAKASSLLIRPVGGTGKLDPDLVRYTEDLRRTARAKAARFLAIDAEGSGKTGNGIAWLRGGLKELGFAVAEDTGKRKGLKGFKQTWAEKREDKKVEKGSEAWGMDAGRFEEGRVLEWLEGRWVRENNTINVQAIPPSEPLLATMPSGRDYHTPQTYVPPALDTWTLARMRASPDPSRLIRDEDESDDEGGVTTEPIGAFPGTSSAYY